MTGPRSPVLIEGWASLFGVPDAEGDVVRAGAFSAALQRAGAGRVAMLLSHADGDVAGRWTRIEERGRGLFVRGLIDPETPAGQAALMLMEGGRLDGLSIGFVARRYRPRMGRAGRDLLDIDLREVSLVTTPMLSGARFHAPGVPLSVAHSGVPGRMFSRPHRVAA
jgi:uncharacterized protein